MHAEACVTFPVSGSDMTFFEQIGAECLDVSQFSIPRISACLSDDEIPRLREYEAVSFVAAVRFGCGFAKPGNLQESQPNCDGPFLGCF